MVDVDEEGVVREEGASGNSSQQQQQEGDEEVIDLEIDGAGSGSDDVGDDGLEQNEGSRGEKGGTSPNSASCGWILDHDRQQCVGEDSHGGGEKDPGPSKVLHLRRMPFRVSVAEVIQTFGQVRKVVGVKLLFPKLQALVEFESEDAARSVLSHFEADGARIRDATIFLNYSISDHIENPDPLHHYVPVESAPAFHQREVSAHHLRE
jgi:hypothetical protein